MALLHRYLGRCDAVALHCGQRAQGPLCLEEGCAMSFSQSYCVPQGTPTWQPYSEFVGLVPGEVLEVSQRIQVL